MGVQVGSVKATCGAKCYFCRKGACRLSNRWLTWVHQSRCGLWQANTLRRRASNPMKASFLLIAIFSLLVLCAPDVSGEASVPHSSLSADAQHEYLRYLQDLRSKQYLEYLKQNNPYDSPVMYYRLYRKPEPFPWGPICHHIGLGMEC